MIKTIFLTLLLMLLLAAPSFPAEVPEFLDGLEGKTGVIIKMKDAPDALTRLSIIENSRISRQVKHREIINHLKGRILDSQASLKQVLESNLNLISEYKSFWISNAVYVKGDVEFIKSLAIRDDIEYVFENLPLVLVEPVEIGSSTQSEAGAEPGLDVIKGGEAWKMGLNGEGRIVCNLDTGVDGEHPALLSSWVGSNGGTVAQSWFDPYTDTEFPVDNSGHGTHTMGTMVGLDGADTVGVAFGAQWIAAGVVDRGGGVSRTIADILSAFEWAADPDGNPETIDDMPDVINNSWGIPTGFYGHCDITFWDAIDNLETLGIVCLFAAGNEGPNESTIRTPADRITTQFNSFAVGAVNGDNIEVASFSSRGPSGCDGQTIKPEITAPGVHIRSCNDNGGYVTMSGTSMATPHVAGAVAILRQFNPEASVDQVKSALMQGAVDLGDAGEDNSYGSGLLNILNSLYYMPPPDHPFMHVISVSAFDNNQENADPGDTISIILTLENLGSESSIEARLFSQLPEIEILQDHTELGNIGHLDTVSVIAFSVIIPSDIPDDFPVSFTIEFFSNDWSQLYRFDINVSQQAEPAVATISTDILEMSFSNFGQFGLGENSINPFGGVGFRFPAGSDDFMREAALLISSDGRVSDGAQDDSNQPDNDFGPLEGGQPVVTNPGIYADYDGFASYSDTNAEQPIGLEITQRCFGWDLQAQFITVEFTIHNISSNTINDLRVGLFCDWNLSITSGNDDIVGYNELLSLGYVQDISTGMCAGVRLITSLAGSYRAIDNSEVFADGFSNMEKLQFMSEGFIQTEYSVPDDYSHLLSVGPFTIAEGDSEVVAFAFVAGESLEEINSQAELAFYMYPGLTQSSEYSNALPDNMILHQNYPNPFNASTTIEFTANQPLSLEIYDLTGRQVRQYDILSAGTNLVSWDGKNDFGQNVVSGVYFYRISSGGITKTKKMLYLK